MTVLLDTGPLVAFLDRDDPDHRRADAMLEPLLAGRLGLLLSTDFVYDEGMTLIRMRKRSPPLLASFHSLFWDQPRAAPRPFEILTTSLEECRTAGAFLLQHFDQRLSLTDCTLILRARERNAVIATFDGRFEGLAPTVPDPGRGA